MVSDYRTILEAEGDKEITSSGSQSLTHHHIYTEAFSWIDGGRYDEKAVDLWGQVGRIRAYGRPDSGKSKCCCYH